MDEYEASYLRVEKLSNAVQSIKDCLTCRICLELFHEPVTIKCGHKFCRGCILKVTSNENASCPFCSTKIQKRSIPKEGNILLQKCVERFEKLVQAIQSDSGIDVLQPCNKVKDTKESIPLHERPSTSKVDVTPSTSKSTFSIINPNLTKSKVLNPTKSRLSLTKKKIDNKSPSQSSEKNTLHKYLSNKSDSVSDEVVYSQEKVKYWLESCASDKNINAEQIEKHKHNPTSENESEESEASLTGHKNHVAKESKFKETQLRIQEAEMMAKKKKASLSLSEKNIVKTPNSIPATSHSDAFDWRRVKQVGREMQVKTFKALNVSKEKCSPAVVLDDTVPYNSSNNDSRNLTRESEVNKSSAETTPLQVKKRTSMISENDNSSNVNAQIIIEEYKRRSMDSIGSPHEENFSTLGLNEKQLNEIVGVKPSRNLVKTSEKTISSTAICNSKPSQVTSLRRKFNNDQDSSDDEPSNYSNKSTGINLQNSPTKKHRLSLKKSASFANSIPQLSSPSKTDQNERESLHNSSPENLKSRLSLGSSHNKFSNVAPKLASTKSPFFDESANKHSSLLSSSRRISFQKLGKICRKKTNVKFVYLGKLEKEKCIYLNDEVPTNSGIVIKSVVTANVDYKSLIVDKNVADLNEFSGDEPSSPKNIIQSKSPTERSPANDFEEAMHIDQNIDHIYRSEQVSAQMEIDETLSPAKIVLKGNIELETEKSISDDNEVEKIQEIPSKSSEKTKKNAKSENLEKIKSRDAKNYTTKPVTKTYERNTKKKLETEIAKRSSTPESPSKLVRATKSSNSSKEKTKKNNPKEVTVDKVPVDLISISSDNSEAEGWEESNVQKLDEKKERQMVVKYSPKMRKRIVIESCTESEASVISDKKEEENSENLKHYSSTSSSTLKPTLKKKRTYSESSNDDDNVNSILDKWIEDEKDQVVKKAKLSSGIDKKRDSEKKRNKKNYLLDSSSSDEEVTLANEQQANLTVVGTEPKRSLNTEVDADKLNAIPSSLQSADLFETNEQSIPLNPQIIQKQPHETIDKNSKVIGSDEENDKENISERSSVNVTIIDTRQSREKKFISPKSRDSGNKENNECNQLDACARSIKNTEDPADEIESSQKEKNQLVPNFESESDPYFVRDSLFNITEEQIACKNIEKDLLGVDLSRINENQNEEVHDSKCSTPRRKTKHSEENYEFDSDNIEATPHAKRRHIFRLPSSQSSNKSIVNASELFSPGKNISLIPAVTPMKNRKSYPLCHSTPMICADSPGPRLSSRTNNITIVGSSLSMDNTKLVQQFVDRFNAKFQTNFDSDVTHVVVKVDPETKAGPKTFKYVQGIAFKKHVVSFQWITDCLAENKLLDADDEKYDVLDPYILESGCRKSRLSSEKLLRKFTFFCLEPFEKVPLSEFKELLSYNGATIVTSMNDLLLEKEKYKIIITESDLSNENLAVLSRIDAVIVYLEWIVDSFSQFQLLPLTSYLCETPVEKARHLGFPPELLIEEDTLDEEEEDDEGEN